jgi:hypothetical protein
MDRDKRELAGPRVSDGPASRRAEAVQGCAASVPKPMGATELRAIIERLGISQGDFARLAERNESRVRKMCRGKFPIDDALAAWARTLGTPPQKPPRAPHEEEHEEEQAAPSVTPANPWGDSDAC